MSEPIIEYRDEFNVMDFVSKYAERISRVIDEQTLVNVEHQLAEYGYVKVVRCRDCKYADISYTHAAVTGELHCYGYLVESWDWYNDMPSDGVKVKPDGFCAWGERKERIES